MAAIDETGEHGSTKTFVNRTPAGDVRAGILDGDHGDDDRSAAGPARPAGSRKGQLPVRNLDMSRIGEAAASDRYSITALMAKNRTYGPDRVIQILVLALLDDIIRTPKELHALTLLDPVQFDYMSASSSQSAWPNWAWTASSGTMINGHPIPERAPSCTSGTPC